jgi:hypothetical protein
LRRLHWLLLVLPTLGFTECEHFRTVTVPPSDSVPPTPWHLVNLDGVETLQHHPQLQVDADTWFTIFPALQDSSGVASLHLFEQVKVTCTHDSSGAAYFVSYPSSTYDDAQSGTVGSSVSDGIFAVGSVSNLGGYLGACTPGYHVTNVLYYWYLSGSDFHGNVYEPWGWPTGTVSLTP